MSGLYGAVSARITALMIGLMALSACVVGPETWTYQEAGSANIVTRKVENSTGFLSKRYTNVAIHRETSRCQFEYIGTIMVDDSSRSASLPVGERLMLQFNFIDVDFGGPGAHDSIDRLFTAKAGHVYELEMSYGKVFTDYTVFDMRGGQAVELTLRDLSTCE